MAVARQIIIAWLLLAAASTALANSVSLAGDEGVTNLRWRSATIRLAISASLLKESANIKRDSDVSGALKRSIEAWSSVANVDFVQASSEKLSASPTGPAGDGVNLITIAPTAENVLLFSKDPDNTAATTRVFYNRRGMITEADIVLNPYQQFSTDGTFGTFDLEATLTHEIGHLLGLNHSSAFGSTMHTSYGKNGVFGLQNFSSRTLSAIDIAAIRSIYGARGESTECCGNVEGRLTVSGKQARTPEIWIEDMAGRVHGTTRAVDGEFKFSGLSSGKYRLFAHEPGKARSSIPAQALGEVVVVEGETAAVTAKVAPVPREIEINYLGFNGQLSEMAVTLSAGRSYVVYIGGRNLDPKKLTIGFTSPNLQAVNGTMRYMDYGDDISVVSFEVRVAAGTPKGEYSIFIESDRGDKQAIVGGLTVDSFQNPWASLAGLDE